MNLNPSSAKEIGNFLFSHKLFHSLRENKDELLSKSLSFQVNIVTIGLEKFEKFLKSAGANTLTKLSRPYLVILEKIHNMFGKAEMSKAHAEIKRLRTLSIEQAAYALVKYSKNVEK